MKSFIIAEAGDNHNGNIDLAYKLIDIAIDARADCVKFQTFVTEEVISKKAEKAEYQKTTTGASESQYDMVKKLELSFDQFKDLANYCKDNGIIFMSTPFDLPSIAFLDTLDMPYWKIPSGEITNLPYLIKIAETGKPIILSTGMCSIDEISTSVSVLEKHGAKEVSLLHCTTQYPTPMADVNLSAMLTLKNKFDCMVGYSDHTLGIEVPIAARAMGASIIEKHFTIDKTMEGPDHRASLEPDELKAMVMGIRNIELALGDGDKKPAQSEIQNIEIARKSITARAFIKKGTPLTEDNLSCKRPATGISPMQWFDVIGTKAVKDFEEDDIITL